MEEGLEAGRRAVFFAPDVAEVPTRKRVDAFLEHGLEVTVFAFQRDRFAEAPSRRWPWIRLGRTIEGHYGRRMVALLRGAGVVLRHRRLLADADFVYARNIDQLLLALLARRLTGGLPPISYEVLDVMPAFTRTGPAGLLLRGLERLLLRRVDLLVVSSPGFLRHYYEPVQNYRGRWFLLENKLHPSVLAMRRPAAAVKRGKWKWVIGYFGLIRGHRTIELITRIAERFPQEVLFRFRGVVAAANRRQFAAALAGHPNMTFGGPYDNPADLAELYGGVDFVWAIDLEDEAHNSRWLMPCRFYEGGLFGVPLLAARGFEVGERVDALGAGWTFPPPYETAMADFLAGVTEEERAARQRRLLTLPPDTFVAGDEAAALCRLLGRAGAGAGDGDGAPAAVADPA